MEFSLPRYFRESSQKRARSYLDAPKKLDTMANLPLLLRFVNSPPKRSRGRSSSDKRAVGFWLTIAPRHLGSLQRA
ncbi:hypothetical protein CEXT_665041 [Caerostris extrusa]|uniref:Uncharacterized protein n=1 Tax=Caerostris extrusa TaxID=172846 RepID=A0AAV4RLB4_CAEEX|nr:hypothetical protein CEXT_665041 [Caerostris extrusa]